MSDDSIIEVFEVKEITEKIKPSCKAVYRLIQNIYPPLIPPPLHRQVGTINSCKVLGCNQLTSNDCSICIGCHPLMEDPEFPCYLRR